MPTACLPPPDSRELAAARRPGDGGVDSREAQPAVGSAEMGEEIFTWVTVKVNLGIVAIWRLQRIATKKLEKDLLA